MAVAHAFAQWNEAKLKIANERQRHTQKYILKFVSERRALGFGVKFTSTQHEELTVTEAILKKKNDDDDSSFSRERKQRTGENERETKILYLCERNNKYGRDDCCVYILLHMMAVEVVNVVACCSDHTYTNRNRTNEVHRGMCVWRECAANVVDYKYVR